MIRIISRISLIYLLITVSTIKLKKNQNKSLNTNEPEPQDESCSIYSTLDVSGSATKSVLADSAALISIFCFESKDSAIDATNKNEVQVQGFTDAVMGINSAIMLVGTEKAVNKNSITDDGTNFYTVYKACHNIKTSFSSSLLAFINDVFLAAASNNVESQSVQYKITDELAKSIGSDLVKSAIIDAEDKGNTAAEKLKCKVVYAKSVIINDGYTQTFNSFTAKVGDANVVPGSFDISKSVNISFYLDCESDECLKGRWSIGRFI